MKKYLIYLFTLASTLLIGCDSFRDMSGTAEVNPITVDVYLDITVENISTLKDLTVKFDNYDEDLHYVKEGEVDMASVITDEELSPEFIR